MPKPGAGQPSANQRDSDMPDSRAPDAPALFEGTLNACGDIIDNRWVVVRDGDAQGAVIANEQLDVIVPLALWRSGSAALRAREGRVGVWLNCDDEPAELAGSIHELPIIAVNFPAFNDGRALSVAVLLRTRMKYTGELRAIGDVRQDQLSYMRRCGFTTFTPAPDANFAELRNGLVVMTDYYQGSVLEPSPLFRRRAPGGA